MTLHNCAVKASITKQVNTEAAAAAAAAAASASASAAASSTAATGTDTTAAEAAAVADRWTVASLRLDQCTAAVAMDARFNQTDGTLSPRLFSGQAQSNATFEGDTGHYKISISGAGSGSLSAVATRLFSPKTVSASKDVGGPLVPANLVFLEDVNIATRLDVVVDSRVGTVIVKGKI